MADHLIDELVKAIEEQANPARGFNDARGGGGPKYDASPVPMQRGFLEIKHQASAPPRSSQIYGGYPISQYPPQKNYEAISQPNAINQTPLNFSVVHSSIPKLQRSDANSRRRSSRTILIDQSQIHPLHRGSHGSHINSLDFGRPETIAMKTDSFSYMIDSTSQTARTQGLLSPPSATSRRHSTDVDKPYMALSDTKSISPESPQSSRLKYKKWMKTKSGPHGIERNLTDPASVDGKQAKTKSSALSKSKSLFSHFKYEMLPTPSYYVPEDRTKPATRNLALLSRPNPSFTNTTSTAQNDTTNIRSRAVSIPSHDKMQQISDQDDLKLPLAQQSSLAKQTPQATSPSTQQPTSLLPHLGWNTDRFPDEPKDFQRVEGWLANTYTESTSPAAPPSPLFSERRITSTAPSSPAESKSLSMIGTQLAKDEETKMHSRIASWVDLDGCTPEFVHSLQVLGTLTETELEPETAFELAAEDITGSILSTPSSKYMDSVFDESVKSSSVGVISAPGGSTKGDRHSGSTLGPKSPTVSALPTSNSAVQPPKSTTSESPRTSEDTLPGSKRPKPKIAPLIIPSTTYTVFQPSQSHGNSFPEGDSPTLPVLLDSPMPRRSLRQPKKVVEVPLQVQTPEAPPSTWKEEDDAPLQAPPIPTRLRPIAPPQAARFAPARGLSLRISRQYVSQTKSEWLIKSPSSALLTCFSTAIRPGLGSERMLDFYNPYGQHIFFFHKTAGNVRVGETKDGKVLFAIRKGFTEGEWNITHTAEDVTDKEEEDGVMWKARVTDADDARELVASWGDFEAGRIRVENGKLRNTYTVTVSPHMNYCIMAALTTVFDEWRVDEGFH